MTDRVGEHLGNYRLTKLLGQGGFADVYLGEHIHLSTQAAIKVLHTQLAPDDLEGFRTEARTIARLEHPNIVRMLEFGIEAGVPFLVMSYAPNGSLRQHHLKGVPLPLPMIVSYVRQIADALQYAHDEKVIHRDVKPENMLVGRRHEVLLSDFGIALIAQSTSSQSKQDVTGTIHYMAPEQIRGKPRPASDQYALGVVVYEWLTGARPFHGSFTEIATQHMFVPPPPLHEKNPTIASDLEHVVMIALAKDPHQRWASVQAFATALEQACLPTQHPPIGSSSRQPLAPTVAALPPTQHSWSAIATPPSNQPVQSDVITPQPVLSQPPQRQITRRTIVVGAAGLVVAGIAGSGLIWALSHPTSGSPAIPASINTPARTATATPTPTPRALPQGTILYTYRGFPFNIRVLAWSANGERIAGGSDDHTAQVWDATMGNNPVIYRGHSSYVEGVAWSPDGKYIASGEQSSTGGHVVQVRVWEAATGNTIVIYRGHTNGVFAVAWSPDGTRVASCGYDGTVQVWEGTTGRPISTYKDTNFHFGLAWSPDSQRIVVGGIDPQVRVLDATTGKIVYIYSGPSSTVGDVAWSPDGTRIAAGSDDQTVHLFQATDGTRIYIYQGQAGHIDALTWSPTGSLIASGSNNGTVQVWQAK